MTTTKRPTKPCYVCGANDWWQRSDGGWNCGRCHPNPDPGSNTVNSLRISSEKYTPEVLALRNRVCLGNDKLFAAWLRIRDIEDREEKEYQFDRWNEAQRKLHTLCDELKYRFNFHDCLYLDENGKKTKRCIGGLDEWWCQVCPSERAWWSEELMSLPSSGEE